MKPITREWIEKAEGDFAMMEREGRARKQPNYDGICFHAQQCAEKYLKARLSESAIEFRNTHDLPALLDLIVPREPLWEVFRRDLAYLSDFAVVFRYPGESATRDQAKDAIRRCRAFREHIRQALKIPRQERRA
ncbi:MAG: HEPN domain-containing protein [Verrucomicrobia bacterium]|nr:HEPN domain-containing protein [Verrucomicrobiota bacterium]MBU1734992.1 HEPN domain-containing protein [Verrucomicrobiota bacterium]MBU1856265.1 HEPN domain-containing protein [Verrucomicrobiota bacterium]